MRTNMNPGKADLPIKKYIAAASVLLLFLTLYMPSLGLMFACGNLVFFAVWYLCKHEKPGERLTKRIIWGSILGNIWILVYLSFQNFSVSPSFSGDFQMTVLCEGLLRENIPAFFREFYYGALLGEESILPALFIAPPLGLFGNSYVAYVLLIFNLFVVPFLALMAMSVHKIQPKCEWLVFAFVPFLTPVLCGSLDGAGLLGIGLWIYLVQDRAFRKWSLPKGIVLGLITGGMLLMRSWCVFFVVGTVASLLLSGAIRKCYDKTFDLRIQAKNMGLIGGTALLVVLLIFRALFGEVVHAQIAGGYGFGTFWPNIRSVFTYYGFLPLFCFALGLGGLFRKRYRQFTLFLLLQFLFTFLLFGSVHTIDYSHHYMLAAALFLLGCIGIEALPKRNKEAFLAYAVIVCLSFVYAYAPIPGAPLDGVLGNRLAPDRQVTVVNIQN